MTKLTEEKKGEALRGAMEKFQADPKSREAAWLLAAIDMEFYYGDADANHVMLCRLQKTEIYSENEIETKLRDWCFVCKVQFYPDPDDDREYLLERTTADDILECVEITVDEIVRTRSTYWQAKGTDQ